MIYLLFITDKYRNSVRILDYSIVYQPEGRDLLGDHQFIMQGRYRMIFKSMQKLKNSNNKKIKSGKYYNITYSIYYLY